MPPFAEDLGLPSFEDNDDELLPPWYGTLLLLSELMLFPRMDVTFSPVPAAKEGKPQKVRVMKKKTRMGPIMRQRRRRSRTSIVTVCCRYPAPMMFPGGEAPMGRYEEVRMDSMNRLKLSTTMNEITSQAKMLESQHCRCSN